MNIERLRKWKPVFKRDKPFSMLIIGSRRGGKSYLCRHLCRDFLRAKYDIFVVVSDSPDTPADLMAVLPQHTIYLTDMDYTITDNLQIMNEERAKEGKQPLQMLIIFDDKISTQVKNDDRLLQLFTRGRHLSLSVIFISQAKKFTETTWLNNADYIILTRPNVQQQKKTLLDNVVKGTVPVPLNVNEDRYLRALMDAYLKEVGNVLVVDNMDAICDNLYWYRAP